MMSLETFRRSLSDPTPPEELDLALQALWWAGKGDWTKAHAATQRQEGNPRCDWVHAYLHRQEGNSASAGQWYRRAGQPVAEGALQAEWAAIAAGLLQQPARSG